MRHRRTEVGGELDLIPVLSLVVHIIPMLLLSVRFVELNQHGVNQAPVEAKEAPSRELMEEQERELVVVRISPEGFVVKGASSSDASLPCRAPCAPSDYDYEALNAAMVAARARNPATEQVVVAPHPSVPYEVIVGVFDAATQRLENGVRRPLFPDPVLVTGAFKPEAAAP